MSIKSVVKIVRPDQTAPFFYQSEAALPYADYTNAATDAGIITSITSVFSSDKLTLNRMVTYRDQEAKDAYLEELHVKYPDFEAVRQTYCDEHDHVLTIVTP